MPFYYDAFGGAAGDPAARELIGKQRPALVSGSMDVNPLLFLAPDGKIVAELSSGEATTAALLATLQRVLKEHAAYARPAPDEAALTGPIERAELAIDLQRDEEADRILESVDTPRAHYLRGRLARWRGDFQAMHGHFAKVGGAPDLVLDCRMEAAYELWQARDFEQLAVHLADFPETSRRYTEARYFEGLARHHAGRTQEARALWRATIQAKPQDAWIYRMDWAWSDTAKNAGATSVLGRIGYFGAYRNPDVSLPKK